MPTGLPHQRARSTGISLTQPPGPSNPQPTQVQWVDENCLHQLSTITHSFWLALWRATFPYYPRSDALGHARSTRTGLAATKLRALRLCLGGGRVCSRHEEGRHRFRLWSEKDGSLLRPAKNVGTGATGGYPSGCHAAEAHPRDCRSCLGWPSSQRDSVMNSNPSSLYRVNPRSRQRTSGTSAVALHGRVTGADHVMVESASAPVLVVPGNCARDPPPSYSQHSHPE